MDINNTHLCLWRFRKCWNSIIIFIRCQGILRWVLILDKLAEVEAFLCSCSELHISIPEVSWLIYDACSLFLCHFFSLYTFFRMCRNRFWIQCLVWWLYEGGSLLFVSVWWQWTWRYWLCIAANAMRSLWSEKSA